MGPRPLVSKMWHSKYKSIERWQRYVYLSEAYIFTIRHCTKQHSHIVNYWRVKYIFGHFGGMGRKEQDFVRIRRKIRSNSCNV